MSSGKLFKTPQLALADFDLHLIQDLPHLLFRDSKILSDLEAHGTGELSILGFLFDQFLYFFSIHNELHHPLPFPPPSRGRVGLGGLEI